MKILICFGTRPEAIKMAPVIHEFSRQKISYKVCVTAQHREMLDQVLEFFEIVPDFDLNLMKPDQSLNTLSASILTDFDKILLMEEPDYLLVQGDTTTATFAAVAAFHRQIKVGHVEAGLRTYNKNSPYPEEINRQLISRIADLHFAPTKAAEQNLLKEEIQLNSIFITGNTVVDALLWGRNKSLAASVRPEIYMLSQRLSQKKKLILVTGHRRENLGTGLESLSKALLRLAQEKDIEIIFPVHLNPNVRSTVLEKLSKVKSIHLIEPVTYPVLIWLFERCDLIISDSGGIQEEAPSFRKPVIVTRQFSERKEGIEEGFSFPVGTDENKIFSTTLRLLKNPPDLTGRPNPYGDGNAASRIVGLLQRHQKDFSIN